MANSNIVVQGKATLDKVEKIHGRIADIYDNALDKLQTRYTNNKGLLLKDDLMLLKQAQDFVKSQGVEVDISAGGSGKSLNQKIKLKLVKDE